jgi:cell division septation protein DedD
MTTTMFTNPLGAARRLVLVSCFVLLAPALLSAQAPDDAPMRELVARLDRGETEAVRRELPEYVAKYQNHPGLLYVQARVATDGIEAAKLYQSVIDNYPASEWADDALFNLYQYYYAMGLYKTAELKMQQLRKEYPQSEHLSGKAATSAAASGDAGGKAAKQQTEQPASSKAAPAGAAPSATESTAARDHGNAAVTGGAASQTTQTSQTAKETPSGQSAEPVASPSGTEPYTLQVGAFSTSENARKQKAFFEERGYVAEITNRVRSGKSLYLVWVGSYPTADTAKKTLREIQSRYNITPIVVER